VPISPLASTAATFIIGVWKRKFSWTARKTPARSAARAMATASSQVGAKGFCTMVAMPLAIAFSTSAR